MKKNDGGLNNDDQIHECEQADQFTFPRQQNVTQSRTPSVHKIQTTTYTPY